ncbi:MAG: hypothetical protein EOO43_00770, partial [Flavobacterium sp.]
MATTIFNTFIIPGELINGELKISICFELDTDHPVLTSKQSEADIFAWKEVILQFPNMVRFMHQNGQMELIQKDGTKIPLTAIDQSDVNDAEEASKLWAQFLGYEDKGKGSFGPRIKNVNPDHISTAGMRTISRLPKKTLPMVITANAVTSQITTAVRSNFNNSSAMFPASVDKIFSAIELHPLVATSRTLDKSVMDGIGVAFQADVDFNQTRFKELKNKALYFKHTQLTNFSQDSLAKLSPDNRKKMDFMLDFQPVASLLLNEPEYIKEGVQKLGGSLPLRRFIGSVLDFKIPFSKFIEGDQGIQLSNNNSTSPLYKLIGSAISFQYVSKMIKEPNLNAIILAPINPQYATYYEKTLAKLTGKTRIISHEAESVQRNLAQAKESIGRDAVLSNLTLDMATVQQSKTAIVAAHTPKQKIAIQSSRIKLNIINKAAIKTSNQITNIQTKGQQLVVTDANWLKYDPNLPARVGTVIYEHDLLSGYVVYQRIKENGKVLSDWQSLSRIKEYFGLTTKVNKKFVPTELAIDVDSFVNSVVTDPITGNLQLQGVNTGFLFHFDGTTVSSRNPLRHYERQFENEQDQRDEDVLTTAENISTTPPEITALYIAGKKYIAEDYFPFKKKVNSKYVIARDFVFKTASAKKVTPRLKFSETRTYEYVMAMQYLNGYSPIDEVWLKKATDSDLKEYISEPTNFLRHDHIKEVIVSLGEDIFYPGTKKPKQQFTGETVNDLVIRKGTILNNDECVRYLTPSPVPTFQTYLWYDFEKNDDFSKSRGLSSAAMFPLYNKYQCEIKSEDEFKGKTGKTCKQNCGAFCGGTAQPPVYNGRLNYLPDPIVNGYHFQFYYDKDCTETADLSLYPDQYCELKKGIYPQLQPWAVKLVRTKPSKKYVTADPNTQELKIYVPDGKQIFATCLPTFNKAAACFEEEPLLIASIQEKSHSVMTVDPLRSGAIVLSFTSAIQRPLFEPEILDITFTKYKKGTPKRTSTSVTANLELRFEHLNHWGEVQVQGTQPTGELELYGLWDDYSTNKEGPQRSIDEKRTETETGGFVFLGKVEFKNPEESTSALPKKIAPDEIDSSDLKAQVVFEFDSSFPIHYFTPSVFKVRNTSKFISYFEDVNVNEKNKVAKEQFSRWSKETKQPEQNFGSISYLKNNGEVSATSGYLFNNQKPAIPVIQKIIPLIVRDDELLHVSYSERIRLYYDATVMGKDGRLGIIINTGNSVYSKYLLGYVSHAGIDSVMDNFDDRLNLNNNMLGKKSFIYDSPRLEREYIRKFKPTFDDLDVDGAEIGLISYIPAYDPSQELWYV